MARYAGGGYLRSALADANQWRKAFSSSLPGLGNVLGSIIAAAILLIAISVYACRVDTSGDSDFKKVQVLVGIEYALFLGGLFCFALRLAEVWLSS